MNSLAKSVVAKTMSSASPQTYLRREAKTCQAARYLFMCATLESAAHQDACVKALANGLSRLPWSPTVSAAETEILLRNWRGSEAFLLEATRLIKKQPELMDFRRVCQAVWQRRSKDYAMAISAIFYLTALGWLWALEADLRRKRESPRLERVPAADLDFEIEVAEPE
ncbi:hypothetical protein A3C96_00940 [Candidatus Uhrbacteria bacterium RIFCSPHIGHO2_02_FULL_60_10]|uniref:Uncharacterized protein n=1 Tax=Candidatus Uhrbacteria bacterium RIFCSPHIGHO2_02_FULL_60_10 TaxID=1802392 RepID=A0A1F7U4Y7_9BACT|nr:MAG: hypothetical protein A3C96_00940 [Candidatus Uhrbacteria bacterium RIFCSPHIGHO2_02_FULL_60_10]